MQKGWFTRAQYTYGPVNLATGTTVVFQAESWTPADAPEWEAELSDLWVTQNAGVQVYWTADNQAYNQGAALGFTDAAPAGVRRLPVGARAVRQLSLVANNTSGAVIDGFQITYAVEVRKLTLADQLLYGYGTSPDLEEIARAGGIHLSAVQALVSKGTAPIPWAAQRDRTLLRLGDHAVSGLYHVTAGPATAGTLFLTATRTGEEFLGLDAIAVPGASALTLYGSRDQDQNLVQVNGAAFVQADSAPWDTRYFGLQRMSFATGATTTLTAAPVYVRIGRYRMTNLWRARLTLGTAGAAAAARLIPAETLAKVAAGIA